MDGNVAFYCYVALREMRAAGVAPRAKWPADVAFELEPTDLEH